ncbi:hypothetical protein, partial [Buchananella hordeovulneris]|uniref:hypothetical protein n=1 Tax=Buchananella hordeovulneris TaxID=52770 RepID=UPI001C9E30DD
LDEFTTRLQQALKDFAHNEEQLQQAITQITTDLEKSSMSQRLRNSSRGDGYSGTLPPNMRME